MKHVVVTGATSFIGLALIRKLLRRGFAVTAVCRPGSRREALLAADPALRIVEADISEYAHLDRTVDRRCDILVPLAWGGTRGDARDDAILQEANLRYSIDSVRAALSLGCQRVVTAGSQAEYGLREGLVDEEVECSPVTAYGKRKLDFFKAASDLCAGRGALVIEPRYFSLYGPGDFEGTMIISTLRNMIADLDCLLTKAVQMWDFLYIDDAAEAVVALVRSEKAGGVYNLGSGDSRPLRQYVEEMREICGSSSRLMFGAVPYPATGMVSVQPDISRITKETEWRPRTSFAMGVRAVLEGLGFPGRGRTIGLRADSRNPPYGRHPENSSRGEA